MSQTERQQRLRLLIKKVNQERKRQASQIDILCNDLIGAQRALVRRLSSVGFAATFYKSLLGTTDLRELLTRTDELIREALPGAGVTFFLRQSEGSGVGMFRARETLSIDDQPLEDYFDPELTDRICKSNKPCNVADLLSMGLQGNPRELANVSLATLPLSDLGRPLGFLLISRAMPLLLAPEELHKVGLVTCGLAHAIAGCRLPLHAGH
ncbi:hypothetical protein [Anaerobaca lacustris]|uniref:GAF domain-containing protein n=1 Tax=Anaerobaca lacustris TaxID=3044600 RepID=A0AAW6TT68_9BACT|nr:hypothetical protein [Sedimentisphaerales bacterium M17dextr]